MAQPKVIERLDKLSQIQFSGGVTFLGCLDDDSTLLDSALESGTYIFYASGSSVDFNPTGAMRLYMLNVYSLSGESYENIQRFLEYNVQDPVSAIQIVERLGVTPNGSYSREIYYREYLCDTGNLSYSWGYWISGGSSGGDSSTITCDTALSTSSTNPVQNKIITAALNNKADSGHTHSNYLTATSISGKLDKSGGTMTGALTAQSNTNYTTYQVRNIAFSTSASTPTGNGSILGVYS